LLSFAAFRNRQWVSLVVAKVLKTNMIMGKRISQRGGPQDQPA
jgi:hypothetical protein